MTRTHKASGWTRTSLGHGRWRITPTDGSGDRTVAFMSAYSWADLPGDDSSKIGTDRVILTDGAALPDWAMDWLTDAQKRASDRARAAFHAAMGDADDAPFRDGGW